MESEELYEFLSDSRLVELIEQAKVSDDVLDVINLSENQHSDMLAWCLTPSEGHGQGDSVIKDFLEAAYHASDATIWDNKRFFRKWTPGRIRVTSFGSGFVTREFTVEVKDPDQGGRSIGRLDIFLIDPQNKLLIAIENKVQARLTAEQLDRYQQAVDQVFGVRQVFKEFDFAYIVLDRNLDWYTEDKRKCLGKRWTFLDYTWLEASARRARLQVARNNHAAQMLVSYCQKQTAWESESESRLSELAGEIADRHPQVISAFRESIGKDLKSWTPKTLEGLNGEVILFLSQHSRICNLLISSQGIASLQRKILNALDLDSSYSESGRNWLSFTTPQLLTLTMDDQWWALSINIFHSPDDAEGIYTLRVFWRSNSFDGTIEAELRSHFEAELPGLKGFASANLRRVVVARQLEADAAREKAVKLARRLSESLSRWESGRTT